MTASPDAAPRAQALDASRSFIVEAPAGSGKTELLIQRFLTLLARVERPEQIVAITFTRKAAAEMRERVLTTLRAATADRAAVPAHRIESLELAGRVLAHAEAQGWALIEQPSRLRILTIDSLNAALARQMPILSHGIVSLAVTDDADQLYALAAQRTTESLAEPGPLGRSLRALLAASDNSLKLLERWLAGALAQRDGWLREFAPAGQADLSEAIESNLARLASDRLAAVRRIVGTSLEARLFDILGHASWQAAAKLLLTSTGSWRKRFTRKEGFPADDKPRREALLSVLQDLHARRGLRETIAKLAVLPAPASSGSQRALLQALEQVLPRLLAELRVLFTENACVDHTELALAAQQALGAVDQPSELLLALDRRIEHILVDEFQDTSHLQWRLLELLTAGWEAEEGRSLFLVGDPMQSIYRFRDADLSLFQQARDHGLGGIELRSIALTENHRSAREIVEWVNGSFAPVFTGHGDDRKDVPVYRSAVSSRPADARSGVELHLLGDTGYAAEIRRSVEVVQRELLQDADRSIGILVRSRTHLAGMRAALKRAGLAAHAVEIDSLVDTQLGQDLIGLTQALLHPGDRLSWLGVLRGPWCGLEWSDLLALCNDDSDWTIWERLSQNECLSRMSREGRARSTWLRDRLHEGFALRAALPLGRWIRAAWLAIDGPASLADDGELEEAEGFFCELESLAVCGDVDDPASLRSHFARPRAGAQVPLESGIEIMTIHRAKGLEFDTVILPGLGRTTRGSISKLLLFNYFSLTNGERVGLLAAASKRSEPLVDFLKKADREQNSAELGRLLYVAVTRARNRLHLIASLDPVSEKPKSGSLLAILWDRLPEGVKLESPNRAIAERDDALVHLPLKRLELPDGPPQPAGIPTPLASDAEWRPEFEWVRPASVQVGTLIHRELQRLAETASRVGELEAPAIDIERFRRELVLLGVETEDLESAAERAADALQKVWRDPVGRWILQPRPEAWSELRLTLRGDHGLEHIQLDRSFVDEDGRRWIVDYKTGRHLGSHVEQFLDSEVERYRSQLERYAEAVAETDPRPIRVGLYFPLMTALRDWDPADGSKSA